MVTLLDFDRFFFTLSIPRNSPSLADCHRQYAASCSNLRKKLQGGFSIGAVSLLNFLGKVMAQKQCRKAPEGVGHRRKISNYLPPESSPYGHYAQGVPGSFDGCSRVKLSEEGHE